MSQRGRGTPRGPHGGGPGRFDGASDSPSERGGSVRGRGGFGGDRGGRGGGDRGGRAPYQKKPDAPIFLPGEPVPKPDPTVTALEDASAKNAEQGPADVPIGDLSLDAPRLPIRRQYGKEGTPIILRANYFSVSVATTAKFCRYDVSIAPEEKTKRKKRRLMMMLLEDPFFKAVPAATNFSSILVTAGKLDLGKSASKKFEIIYHEAHEPPFAAPKDGEPKALKEARKRRKKILEIKFLKCYDVQELISSISSANVSARYHNQRDIVQVLNIVGNSVASTLANVTQVGGNVFYPNQGPLSISARLGQGLQALRGYFSSVRLSTKRILLNVNVSHSVFYPPESLPDLMTNFAGPLPHRNYFKLKAFLKSVRVQTSYRWDKDDKDVIKKDKKGQKMRIVKQHTFFDFARDGGGFGRNARQVRVQWKDDNNKDQDTTVEQFFLQKYEIRLQKPLEPVINVGNAQNKVFIPAELCMVVPGQPARRMLSGDQTTNMLNFAARPPNENAISITTHGLNLVGAIGPYTQKLASFGIKVDTNMITVHGRILKAPGLTYAAPLSLAGNPAKQASWNLIGRTFRTGAQLPNWGIMTFNEPNRSTIRNVEEGKAAQEELLHIFKGHGLKMPAPIRQSFDIPPLGREEFRGALDGVLENAFTFWQTRGVRMLLVLLPKKDNWLYARIKLYGDVKFGTATIAMVGQTFLKKQGTTFGNIALKFNLKAGGVNHVVSQGQLNPLDDKTMVVGIDVTHPSPGSVEKAPSIAGVVASYDVALNHFPASIRIQTSRNEMVDELAEMITERLRIFQLKNSKRLPTRILVYRDGVSEGQYQTVLNTEYQSMLNAFKTVYPANAARPKVTIIVVGKRHHTRFYPTKAKEETEGNPSNPRPGTIVDRGITGSGEKQWDFFLQAHMGLQGTAKPAHYVVLKNEMGLTADQVERITHNMSYVYGRATKAVSICPPAYYADLVCERGRAYLYSTMQENNAGSGNEFNIETSEWKRGVHRNLENTMFYI